MLKSPHHLRDSTEMRVDPFSDILNMANAQSVVSGGFTAADPWAIRFPPMEKLKFSAVLKGRCWLTIEASDVPIPFEAGDIILLSGERAFTLSSDLELTPTEAAAIFSPGGAMTRLNHGDDFLRIGGFVKLDPVSGKLLTDVLPPIVHVHATSPHAAILQWLLTQLVREQSSQSHGSTLASGQLAQLIFVQILRAHLETSDFLYSGWLRAFAYPGIAPALRLMHSDPARSWHLEELARSAAMSRTTFATRFKSVAEVPPLTYLLNWRMRIAEKALREQTTPISALAQSLGYISESAFSNTFKRMLGVSPRHYLQSMASNALN
jgi:AraC-like DNA-binding protein